MMDRPTTPVVTIRGKYFYRGTERFIARGLVYKADSPAIRIRQKAKWKRDGKGAMMAISDPLGDQHHVDLLEDVKAMRELNINALWIAHHDPEQPHAKCMDLLAQHGIYVIFEAQLLGVHRSTDYNPKKHYTAEQLEHYSKVIDSVAQFPNTLGVCMANQLMTPLNVKSLADAEEMWTALSRTIRDMKQYMRYRSYGSGQRILPLCVGDGQWSTSNTSTFEYMTDLDNANRPVGGKPDFYCFAHLDERTRSDLPQSISAVSSHRIEEGNLPLPWPPEHDGPASDWSWAKQLPMQKFEGAPQSLPILISEYGQQLGSSGQPSQVRLLYGTNMDSPLLNTLSGGFLYRFPNFGRQRSAVGAPLEKNLVKYVDYDNLKRAMHDAVGSNAREISTDTEVEVHG